MNFRELATFVKSGVLAAIAIGSRVLQWIRRNESPVEINSTHTELALTNELIVIEYDSMELLQQAALPALTFTIALNTLLNMDSFEQSINESNSLLQSINQINMTSLINSFNSEPFSMPFNIEPATPVIASSHVLQQRLEAIQFDPNAIPKEYYDPITCELMEDPVIGITEIDNNGVPQRTEHIYDRSTYVRLNGECPENRQFFIEMRDHEGLKAAIEAFVVEKENAHQAQVQSNGSPGLH